MKIHVSNQIAYSGDTVELLCAGRAAFWKGNVQLFSSTLRADDFPGIRRVTYTHLTNISQHDRGIYICTGRAEVRTSKYIGVYGFNYSMTVYVGGKFALIFCNFHQK